MTSTRGSTRTAISQSTAHDDSSAKINIPSSTRVRSSCPDASTTTSMTPPPSSHSAIPPPIPVDTHPNRAQPPELDRIPDPNRLAPEDAYFAPSISRARSAPINYDESLRSLSSDGTLRPPHGVLDSGRKEPRKLGSTGGRRRRKGAWKKLLWVKQSCKLSI